MWRILEKKKGVAYEKGDYMLEKLSDFQKLAPYLFPKIEGDWKIVLIDLTLKDNITAYTEIQIPDYVDVVSYVKKDVAERMTLKFPELKVVKKTSKELYQDMLKMLPKMMTSKAISELYSRFSGNIDKISEVIPDIVEHSEDKPVIDIKDINAVIPKLDITYAKDVLLSFLLWDNTLIPKRGHRLSGYRWRKPWELLKKLINDLGRDYAFYALRKQVRYLVKEKIAYMHNKEYKEIAVEFVDTYQLSELCFSFELYGSGALEIILNNIKRRKSDDSIFKGKDITYY